MIARRPLGCSLSLSVPALTGPALIVLEDLADSTHSERIATGTATAGVVLLLSPAPPEQEFARSGTSEAESVLALERLADGGRRGRILSGMANLAAGVASLAYPIPDHAARLAVLSDRESRHGDLRLPDSVERRGGVEPPRRSRRARRRIAGISPLLRASPAAPPYAERQPAWASSHPGRNPRRNPRAMSR